MVAVRRMVAVRGMSVRPRELAEPTGLPIPLPTTGPCPPCATCERLAGYRQTLAADELRAFQVRGLALPQSLMEASL